MRVIEEIYCSKCGKKQHTAVAEPFPQDLFWRTCEYCHRYGLYKVIRRRLTSVREWMLALYQSLDFSLMEKFLFFK